MIQKQRRVSSDIYRRTISTSPNTTLPVVNRASFTNVKQKLTPLPTINNKITVSTDVYVTQMKSSTQTVNRSNSLPIPKSSSTQQSNLQSVYATSLPRPLQRARNINSNSPLRRQPSQSQQQQPPTIQRRNSQYGHFLANLQRQSLARTRRKQDEQEGNIEHVETTITLNLNRQPATQVFQSTSHYSFNTSATQSFASPMITMTAKRSGKLGTFYDSSKHSSPKYGVNKFQQPLKPISRSPMDEELFPVLSTTLLLTPRNSVVDEPTTSPIITPYDLYVNDDTLNYCYVSNESGIKYQGQMLSSAV